MDRVDALGDQVSDLAGVLQAVAAELGAARASLRDLSVDDVGPAAASDALTGVLIRLDRALVSIVRDSSDAARAVRRHVAEQPS